MASKQKPNTRKLKVKFNPTAGVGGDAPVFLGHGGNGFWIPQGQVVALPEDVVRGPLMDAVETHYEQYKDTEGNPRSREKEVPRFNYQILGYVEEGESIPEPTPT